uniref:Protein HflC n=1 Tax=OCS116 cluster bacterium TaxID=2030921 RepID=A0A2A4YSL0_9PROT
MIRNLSFVIAAIVALAAYTSAFTVHQTQQVLIFQVGKFDRAITEPGLYFKIPFYEDARFIDKRLLSLDSPVQEVITANQKRLVVDAFARYRIVDPLKFVQSAGGSIANANARLATVLNSSVRRVMGGESLVSVVRDKRAELMLRIKAQTNVEAADFGVEVVDVKIRRADLPEANSASVFSRMQTERQQEAAEYRARGAQLAKRIRAEADRDATVIVAKASQEGEILRGDGDAEKNKIFAEAYGKDPEFFRFYRSMQAYETGLAGDNTSLVLSPDGDFFSYFSKSKQ